MIGLLHSLTAHIPEDRRDLLSAILLLGAVMVVVLQVAGTRQIRDNYGYRGLKIFIAAVITLSITSTLAGVVGRPAQRIGFYVLLVILSIVEFAYLWRKNHVKVYMTLKTRRGLVDILDPDEARLIVSQATAIIRHQKLDNKKYVDEEGIQELLDALGFPSMSEFDAQVRAEMKERRERLARDKILAEEIELYRRERDGLD